MPDAPPAAKSPGKLGLPMLTALVVGNMVGSGVFALPEQLAPFGATSVLGWCVSAAGSMCFALVLARLARRSPATGGPYAYTREAFGEFAAFLVGWGYWISCWCAQAVIAITLVRYLGDLVPGLTGGAGAASAIVAIVLLLELNVAGVRKAGAMQVLTTVLKILPLAAISLFGFTRFEPAHFEPFNPTGEPLYLAVQGCLALTLWAFLGFESATIAAGEARDASRTVPRATLIGIAIATVLYVAATLAVMGLVPREELMHSNAPFALAAEILWGPWARKLVAAGAVVSCFGALNGWILVSGQMPLAIARDGLFPEFFRRMSARGTPAVGLRLSSGLAVLLIALNSSGSLSALFNGIVRLATIAALIPFVFCAMADILLAVRARERVLGGAIVAVIAFAYGMLAIHGAGQEYVSWGFLLFLGGIPFYALARVRA